MVGWMGVFFFKASVGVGWPKKVRQIFLGWIGFGVGFNPLAGRADNKAMQQLLADQRKGKKLTARTGNDPTRGYSELPRLLVVAGPAVTREAETTTRLRVFVTVRDFQVAGFSSLHHCFICRDDPSDNCESAIGRIPAESCA
jgi:hypothetical protein